MASLCRLFRPDEIKETRVAPSRCQRPPHKDRTTEPPFSLVFPSPGQTSTTIAGAIQGIVGGFPFNAHAHIHTHSHSHELPTMGSVAAVAPVLFARLMDAVDTFFPDPKRPPTAPEAGGVVWVSPLTHWKGAVRGQCFFWVAARETKRNQPVS